MSTLAEPCITAYPTIFEHSRLNFVLMHPLWKAEEQLCWNNCVNCRPGLTVSSTTHLSHTMYVPRKMQLVAAHWSSIPVQQQCRLISGFVAVRLTSGALVGICLMCVVPRCNLQGAVSMNRTLQRNVKSASPGVCLRLCFVKNFGNMKSLNHNTYSWTIWNCKLSIKRIIALSVPPTSEIAELCCASSPAPSIGE